MTPKQDLLRRALLLTQERLDRSGLERPNLLFAIHGPEDDLRLEYVMQLPGVTAERLLDLVGAGVRADAGILGIALAVTGAIVGILRDGYTTVVAHRHGERPHVAEVMPECLGDHEDVAAVAMRLLAGDRVPVPVSPGLMPGTHAPIG